MKITEPIALIATALLPIISAAQSPGFTLQHLPLDIAPEVAGNFMELRTNHFHSGLDLKTHGRIGLPVMAVADGWVSRIKVSPWGYGLAVYVDHPSGYTTVYGHLSRFNGAVATTALDAQYAARSFSIDKYLKPGEIPVKSGDTIAFSGNTGGSTAPHLHFEVRRTADQHALDPQAYGIEPVDHVPPVFQGLRLDPLDSASKVQPYGPGSVGLVLSAMNDSTYRLRQGEALLASGRVGLSVNVIDRYSVGSNTCGIRRLEVRLDGTPIYSAHLDEVDFGTQRFANAYMDYGLFRRYNMHYNRCYLLPNDRLAVYGDEPAQGRIELVAGGDHDVEVTATDAAGNRSVLRFTLKGATAQQAATWPQTKHEGTLFRFDRPNELKQGGLTFTLPAKALYQDEWIQSGTAPATAKTYAPLYQVQDEYTPLELAGQVTLALTKPVPPGLGPKLLVVRMVKGRPVPEGGSYADGLISAQVKTLGTFTVMADTVPPHLAPLDLKEDMRGRKGFRIRVGDNLSGLDRWAATLDGTWILLSYDPKQDVLTHVFESRSDKPGVHELKVEVVDERGNKSTLTRRFTR